MGTGFDGPPIIARRYNYRVDTVHDALVVGGCSVGIDRRKGIRPQDALHHIGARNPVTFK